MARSCDFFTKKHKFPTTVLGHEEGVEYLNLAGVALQRGGFKKDLKSLSVETPIYKPTSEVLKSLNKPYDFN